MSIVLAFLFLVVAALGFQLAQSGWPIDRRVGCGLAPLPVWRDAGRQGEFTQRVGRAVTRALFPFIRVRTMPWLQALRAASEVARRWRFSRARQEGAFPQHARR